MTLIIGSTAAKHHFREFPREPKDLDVFSPYPVKDADSLFHPLMKDWWKVVDTKTWIAEPNELYTIKASHTSWELDNGSWDKHVHDLIWLKRRGATLDVPLYDLLYKVWQEVHGKKKVNLAMSAGDFFDDAVPRVYDHDSIHASVAYGDHALYEDFLKPGEEIDIDMAKVKAAPLDVQVRLYREEVAATALERIVIPSNYTASPGRAWKWALRRTITSLVKGWSARFMIDNIEQFVKPDDYVQRHKRNRHKLIRLEAVKA